MWWPLLLLPLTLALRDLEPPPPAPAPAARDTLHEGWLDVRLDHFHAQNTDTFPMRYLYNDAFQDGDDIVIFVGGEWAISPNWVQGGLAYQLAEILGAGLFYTEHRFYGETRPGGDTSLANLRYLTVDQALGDLAQFIQHVKSDDFENGRFRNASVALIGCSYAGSMATWMQLGYPHLVNTVLSDSGPLLAQKDFPEYLEVIAEALRVQGGEQCLQAVETAMRELVTLLATPEGPAIVSNAFNTCTPLSTATALDVATFFWYGITESFAYLVQYAQPGDIPAACNTIISSQDDAVHSLANWIRVQPYTQLCIETRYSQIVTRHVNTSYDSPDATMRLWTYQTCVEYGWYQTTSSERQPFLATVPLEYFHQMCRDFFSSYFDEELLRSGISRTNLLFGGLSHLPDRAVTVQGTHDPWSPMGPTEQHATPLAPVYVVPEISHCNAIYGYGSTQNPELEAVKLRVLNDLHYNMEGQWYAADDAPRLIASATIVIGVVVALLV